MKVPLLQGDGLRHAIDAFADKLPAPLRSAFHRLTRTDAMLLLRMLMVALALLLFFGLADAVLRGRTRTLDEAILLALRNPQNLGDAVGPPWFEGVMKDYTALGSVAVLSTFVLIVAGFLLLRRQYHAAALVIVATLGGAILFSSMKLVFDRPRPIIVPHLVPARNLSFPSGHALVSAVVYLTLGALLARLVKERHLKMYCIGVGMFLTALVGFTRLYLGVHYPTDVIAGWTGGLCWALVCWMAASALQRRGNVEPPK